MALGIAKAVDLIGGGVHEVEAHDGHDPRKCQVIGLDEPATEARRMVPHESVWSLVWSQSWEGKGQQIHIVCRLVHAKKIEGAIVETEVGAHAIEGFPRGQHQWGYAVGLEPVEPLNGTSIEKETAQVEIGMVVRTRSASRLNFITAGRIMFQVESV